MTKAKRLLELIEVVKQKRKFTVQELADEFAVSYRTMWRYLQELSTLGVPLYAEPGGNGGYRMLETRTEDDGSYQIIHKENTTYVGYSFTAPYTAARETEILAPRLWMRLLDRVSELPISAVNNKTALSLFHSHTFTYFITLEINAQFEIPKEMTAICIPAMTYIRKTHQRTLELEDTIQTYEDIYKWAKTKSLQTNRQAFHLEMYDHRFNPRSSSAQFDILVPVRGQTPSALMR